MLVCPRDLPVLGSAGGLLEAALDNLSPEQSNI